MKLLLKYRGELKRGKIVERPNRFTLTVKMGSALQKVYLANPGKLSTVIARGREVLCEPSASKRRKTRYSAFAIKVKNFYVAVNSAFANKIFQAAIEGGALREFQGYEIVKREHRLDESRIDFLLRASSGKLVYTEVKSCTHVERGVAKFPDRPTERGRRHLKLLTELAEGGNACLVIFIIQRPDARKFKPFMEVDPAFAKLLAKAANEGVKIRAMAMMFKPPKLYLVRETLPLELNYLR